MGWTFDDFDLTNWKIQMPVDNDYFAADGGDGDPYDDSAANIKGADFVGFEEENFFYFDATEGAMVFRTPVHGATTSGNTGYVRTELREMFGSTETSWSVTEGGAMTSTLKVTEMPTRVNGKDARIVIAQIKSGTDELVKIYYESDGELYFHNEIAGPALEETRFYFEDDMGNRPTVSLGEAFSYRINVTDGALYVAIVVDGVAYSPVVTDGIDPTEILPEWNTHDLYFKTGIYQGVSSEVGHHSEGTGAAEAYFYHIVFDHAAQATVGDDAINGAAPDNRLQGGEGNDTINGGLGEDTIFGGDDDDALYGDAGDDWVDGGSGNDVLYGDGATEEDLSALLSSVGLVELG